MVVNFEEKDNCVFVSLAGRLDTVTSQELMTNKSEEIAQWTGKEVVIDCSQLEYISSSGIRLLLLIRKSAGENVTLKGMHPEILQILKVTRLDAMFKMAE